MENFDQSNGRRKKTKRICPFMSSYDHDVECSSRCQLYRGDKGDYTCSFMELPAMTWNLKQLVKKI